MQMTYCAILGDVPNKESCKLEERKGHHDCADTSTQGSTSMFGDSTERQRTQKSGTLPNHERSPSMWDIAALFMTMRELSCKGESSLQIDPEFTSQVGVGGKPDAAGSDEPQRSARIYKYVQDKRQDSSDTKALRKLMLHHAITSLLNIRNCMQSNFGL
jgi:hypothetical protein